MRKAAYSVRSKRFRELLIRARLDAGLSQEDVAKSLGRPQSFVSKYETGERRLDVPEFLEVARSVNADAVLLIRRLTKPNG